MHAARRGRHDLAIALLASVAMAGVLGAVRSAGAAAPGPRVEPGAFCTRSRCTNDAAGGWSAPFGFAAAALACVGLGRRRPGTPESRPD